ncbi:MAG TPA: sugar phosphate isomerase/epimerase family protein [Bryobacteraceae bacterium]|nr:sugar phosphate isomerase/epimerase family protein [Bryobacteraceae bacterium]
MIQGSVLHSVSYSGSWGQVSLAVEEFADKAAELGYDGVMLMAKRPHLSVLDWSPERRKELRARLRDGGLRMECVAGYTDFTAGLEHGDIPLREMQIGHVTGLAEMARDLGGALVRVFTGYESGAAPPQAQWTLIVDALRECARRAAACGVTIGVQNHHDIACAVDSLYDLIREVDHPNCRAMFDAWAPALQGADLAAAAAKMAKLTVHTTVANYQMRPRFKYVPALVNYQPLTPSVQAVPVDEGFIDYTAFLSALEDGGYEGAVAYEMCSPLAGGGSVANLDRYARRFLEFMRALQQRRRN